MNDTMNDSSAGMPVTGLCFVGVTITVRYVGLHDRHRKIQQLLINAALDVDKQDVVVSTSYQENVAYTARQ